MAFTFFEASIDPVPVLAEARAEFRFDIYMHLFLSFCFVKPLNSATNKFLRAPLFSTQSLKIPAKGKAPFGIQSSTLSGGKNIQCLIQYRLSKRNVGEAASSIHSYCASDDKETKNCFCGFTSFGKESLLVYAAQMLLKKKSFLAGSVFL